MQSANAKGPASAGPVFDIAAATVRVLAGAILTGLVGLVCLEALLRGGFNYSLGFAEELTGYCVVALTFFGAALALRGGPMFQEHFLMNAWPADLRRGLVRIFVVIALCVCAVLAWKTAGLVESTFSRGRFAPTVLRTPLWIPQLLLPTGFAIIGLFLAEQFLLTFRKTGDDS